MTLYHIAKDRLFNLLMRSQELKLESHGRFNVISQCQICFSRSTLLHKMAFGTK